MLEHIFTNTLLKRHFRMIRPVRLTDKVKHELLRNNLQILDKNVIHWPIFRVAPF